MNIFQRMALDIFNNSDLCQTFFVKGVEVKCITSAIADGFTIADGRENEENFTLDILLPMHTKIKINDRLFFRDKEYKVSHIQIDSANVTAKLYIIALSKGI